jgi:DNA repair exonuclease SbcCD ATPase subunit
MIAFKKVRWKNFLSTGDCFTEVQLNRSHTTLIVGENGAGKSTILDAISFALFGKPFRSVKKDQLVNSINNGKTVVELEFAIGSKEYMIKRGIKPAVFEIYQDGVLVDQNAAVREYQEYLEDNILKMNQKSFAQIVVIGSASYVPFMQLTAAHRREVIEDLLDLQVFSTMNTLLKERITQNKQDIQSTDHSIMLAQQYIKIVNDNLEAMKRFDGESVAKLQQKIDEETEKAKNKMARVSEFKEIIAKIKESHKDRAKIEGAAKSAREHQNKHAKIASDLMKEVEFLEKHVDCPTCKQNITEEFRAKTIQEKELVIQNSIAEIEKCDHVFDKIEDNLNQFVEDDNQIAAMEAEIHNVTFEAKTHAKLVQSYMTEIESIKNRTSVDPVGELQAKSEQKKLDGLTETKKQLLKDKDTLETASLLLKDGGIKAKIIKQYVPIMNKLINKYLASMDFFVQFELDENFSETIKSRFRDEFSYASFSEGEKTRIDLALLFTWRAIARMRNSTTTNLLILDEIFDGALDSGGTDEFLKIINTIDGDNNTFVISHKTDQMYDKFHSIIKFEKYKSFSRIAP